MAKARDDLPRLANVDGAVTAAVREGEDGAGGSDTTCAA